MVNLAIDDNVFFLLSDRAGSYDATFPLKGIYIFSRIHIETSAMPEVL